MDYLVEKFPSLSGRLRRLKLAELPTPVRSVDFIYANQSRRVSVKCDNVSGHYYGGNKVRKLEYLLSPETSKNVRRFATFGTVGSHHALASSLYAKEAGYPCTCFLAHQRRAPGIAETLNTHLALGTEMVRYGGAYSTRVKTIRDALWGRDAWVIPAGGSSWIGAIGFVNAALELAAQVADGEVRYPDRLYVACGTMSTVAGLALGLALVDSPTEIHAVRVSHEIIANEKKLTGLLKKTAMMLHRMDPTFPEDLPQRCRLQLRHGFFAGGYAHSNEETNDAIHLASGELGLVLEQTYTGKAMAALLHDLRCDDPGRVMFWNTYNSIPLSASTELPDDPVGLPEEFWSYFD